MKFKELKVKSIEELKKLYLDLCQKRQEQNFKVANQQLKNVREIRQARKNIAQILTILKEKSSK
ncbi:50S ribosomal protein L29 [Patescibacteria group bacterium]|nr:50S ribosomal protein L29 [Patescibacteria group bacterium]